MADDEHVKILKQGVRVWNRWREDNPGILPQLAKATLNGIKLSGADLNWADFYYANLDGADLTDSDLSWSDFWHASIIKSNLKGADLKYARLDRTIAQGALLVDVDFLRTVLTNANLTDADLSNSNFTFTDMREATLDRANFSGATFGMIAFGDIDFSTTRGLDLIKHSGPSYIGIDCIYRSQGNIPKAFLRGCGVPDDFITFIPSHFSIQQAIQFYSCFISYSTKDEEFAQRLYSRMRDEKLRVWFAPEDV
jgi:hypothetical protein